MARTKQAARKASSSKPIEKLEKWKVEKTPAQRVAEKAQRAKEKAARDEAALELEGCAPIDKSFIPVSSYGSCDVFNSHNMKGAGLVHLRGNYLGASLRAAGIPHEKACTGVCKFPQFYGVVIRRTNLARYRTILRSYTGKVPVPTKTRRKCNFEI